MIDNQELKVKLKTEVCDYGPLKHKILIKNISLHHLTEVDDKYRLIIKKRNKRQILLVKIDIQKNIIQKEMDYKEDICSISFANGKFHIKIERLYAVKRIQQLNELRYISYSSKPSGKLGVKVRNWLEEHYYMKKLLPQITEVKKKRKTSRESNKKMSKPTFSYPKTKKHVNKMQTYKTRPKHKSLSPEEHRRRDFYNSDLFASNLSPNSDGNRSKREVFGGNGNNMSRSRKKYR